MDKKLEEYLKENGVAYIEHKHPAVFTVEESKKIKNKIPGLHCKTLFLKDNEGAFYLVGLPADKRLDSKKLIKELGVKKIRFATAEELKDEVDLIPGSVSILGIINNGNGKVSLILDKEVWDAKSVGFHPNINTSTLEMKHEDLEKFYNSLKCKKRILKL